MGKWILFGVFCFTLFFAGVALQAEQQWTWFGLFPARPTVAPPRVAHPSSSATGSTGSCPDPEIVREEPSRLPVCLEEWKERQVKTREVVRFLNGLERAYKRNSGFETEERRRPYR